MNIELHKLSPGDGLDIYEMLQEIPDNENGFFNSCNGLSFGDYKKWLVKSDNISKNIELEDWMVPQDVYWLYINGKPVGFGKLRHYLNDKLRIEGGHCGYAIRPSSRGNGYGKLLLKLMLEEAKKLNIDKLLITVNNDNAASIRTAVSNGGIIENITDKKNYIWILI